MFLQEKQVKKLKMFTNYPYIRMCDNIILLSEIKFSVLCPCKKIVKVYNEEVQGESIEDVSLSLFFRGENSPGEKGGPPLACPFGKEL